MLFIPYLLGFVLIMNIILAFTVIFLERRDATSTWAWLMVLFFIPIAGFILYLIFGRQLTKRGIFKWDAKSELGVKTAVQKQLRAIEQGELTYNHEELVDYKDLYYLHLRNNDAVLTQDNDVRIFTDGKEKFDSLIRDLKRATDHIHLLYYIVRNDDLGTRIADVLVERAQAGVEVRLLYDDMGSRRLQKKYVRRLTDAGVEVVSFFPPKIPKINLKINFRNHRKLAIIDGRIGYIGGFNIGDEYLGKAKKFGYWRDTHLRIQGGSVQNMQIRFILDWNQASSTKIIFEERFYDRAHNVNGNVGVQIVSSGPDSQWEQIKLGYIKMILSAKEYIYIQTPYFIPDESLRDALRIAALSGVKVKLMIPNKPDHMFVYWATMSHVGDLLEAGAEAYIYQKGFLHAKTIVVDGKIASVGTANIDVRSFRLNFEINAFLYDKIIAEELVEQFDADILESTQMTRKLYQERSLGIRFKESVSRLLSPIL
ncbi:MAG TPA: cardiolipin synthase [Bacillota bacterium]|nr:cardiolipin synthase [Bacillota bacterium]